ncbi:MAG: trans-sulfuration enzyme family protein [Mangrovicoccus sp.]
MSNEIPLSTLIRRTPWPDGAHAAMGTPLQPSVVYTSADPDALDAQYLRGHGYTYAREGHPNASVLAQKLDLLEGGKGGLVLGSGMAAATAILCGLLNSGEHVLGGDQLYGRTLRLMSQDLPRWGIETSFADPTNIAAMEAAMQPNTKMIIVEVVANPTLRIADINGIAALAKARNALLVIDNTFTTPAALRGFDLGADIVFHSVTKLLSGHSDATLGYAVARDPELQHKIRDMAVTMGLTPSPFDCWLAERGLFTFDLRYERASANAAMLAEELSSHEMVKQVIYPGRSDHPDAARATELLGGAFGNMLSFELQGGRDAANRFVHAAQDLPFAPTLGDVATTLSHPASSSHRGLSSEARLALGITEGFFRLSVGIEPPEYLKSVVQSALKRC